MNKERFAEEVKKFEDSRVQVLLDKNSRYAPCDDALHNFHVGARIDNSTTPQTIWHYMKKHFVSLLDKIESNDFSNWEDFYEKIGDIMNYMDFLWCAAMEEYEKWEKMEDTEDIETTKEKLVYEHDGCYGCKYMDDMDFDEENLTATNEPCASCKGNYIPSTEEYKNAPDNYVPKEW